MLVALLFKLRSELLHDFVSQLNLLPIKIHICRHRIWIGGEERQLKAVCNIDGVTWQALVQLRGFIAELRLVLWQAVGALRCIHHQSLVPAFFDHRLRVTYRGIFLVRDRVVQVFAAQSAPKLAWRVCGQPRETCMNRVAAVLQRRCLTLASEVQHARAVQIGCLVSRVVGFIHGPTG